MILSIHLNDICSDFAAPWACAHILLLEIRKEMITLSLKIRLVETIFFLQIIFSWNFRNWSWGIKVTSKQQVNSTSVYITSTKIGTIGHFWIKAAEQHKSFDICQTKREGGEVGRVGNNFWGVFEIVNANLHCTLVLHGGFKKNPDPPFFFG